MEITAHNFFIQSVLETIYNAVLCARCQTFSQMTKKGEEGSLTTPSFVSSPHLEPDV